MFGLKEKKILFYYGKDRLFDDVGLMSAYMARNVGDVDKYAITEDERPAFDLALRTCLPNIYDKALKLTSGLGFAFADGTASITFEDKDAAGKVKSRQAGKYVDFYINNYEAFNPNVLTLVDASLEECLKYGILTEYYTVCLEPNLLKMATGRYTSALTLLEQRLFQLKKRVSAKEYVSF